MEKIKNYLESNKTIRLMLLDFKNDYNRLGAFEQIRLDVGCSLEDINTHYLEILKICE